MAFSSEVWHPNVYWGGQRAGEVCISILHPPGGNPDAPDECESDAERWNPAHSVTTIILSVISMLSDPNFSSPANVDASVQWRRDLPSFKAKVQETIIKSRRQLPRGFEFPKPRKPHIEKILMLSTEELDTYYDDNEPISCGGAEVATGSGNEHEVAIAQLEGIGFERSAIVRISFLSSQENEKQTTNFLQLSVIEKLQAAGKKVHQDSIMEHLG